MAKTGERYTATRKALLDQSKPSSGSTDRRWVSQPEMSDERMKERTGRGHNEWADIIEAWDHKSSDHESSDHESTDHESTDHAAIARWLEAEFAELDGWWAQAVTVSYERITGLRLPFQRADGTFACSKSRTVTVDADALRKMLLSDGHRQDLFPNEPTELRSKPTTKRLRIAIGPDKAVALVTISDMGDGQVKVTVEHEKLPTHASVEEWKFYWSDWLDAIDT